MPQRRTNFLGVIFLVVGIGVLGTWNLWLTARTVLPVNIPVSMAIGHVRTSEFKLNLNAPYTIGIEVKKTIPFDTLNCLLGTAMPHSSSTALGECPDRPSVVKASWILTSDGQTVARGSSDDHRTGAWMNESIARHLGSFQGQSGRRYVLDLNVLTDGSSLDRGNPRLIVEAVLDDVAYSITSGIILLGTAALALVGIILMIVSWRRNRGPSPTAP